MTMISPLLAERSEAELLFDFETAAPADVQAELGMAAARIGGGAVLSMREDPSTTRFWNKAGGFTEPITDDLFQELTAFYRAERSPTTTVQVAPSRLPGDWEDLRQRYALEPLGVTVKLACPITDIVPPRRETGIRVARVPDQALGEWARVMLSVFRMDVPGLLRVAAASARRPGWHVFAAWDGDDLVGTGTLRAAGGIGQFFGGATLAPARGKGVQGALLHARAVAAREAGCQWLVGETAEGPNPSLRNLERLGMRVLYERQDWVLRVRA